MTAAGNGKTEKDLLLQLLESVAKLDDGQRGLQGAIDKHTHQLNNINGTLTLMGRVLNELAQSTYARVEDHEKRLQALERKAG